MRKARPSSSRSLSALAITVALACVETDASACPSCEPGRAARLQFWRDDFSVNLAVALLPFVIVVAVSEYARGSGARRERTAGQTNASARTPEGARK